MGDRVPAKSHLSRSRLAHTELGGPTGSVTPDPLHPLRPVGAVTLSRIAKDVLDKATDLRGVGCQRLTGAA